MGEPKPQQILKKQEGSVAVNAIDIKGLQERLNPFVNQMFANLKYDSKKTENTDARVVLFAPGDINYSDLYYTTFTEDLNPSTPPLPQSPLKSCEYTINPETANMDWEAILPEKVKILHFSQFTPSLDSFNTETYEKGIQMVIDHLVNHHSDRDKYYFPGIEYQEYLTKRPDRVPESMKKIGGNTSFYFGSILQDAEGVLRVPSSVFARGQIHPSITQLINDWNMNSGIVVIEK